jgi:endo-1,4-beta-xylanase
MTKRSGKMATLFGAALMCVCSSSAAAQMLAGPWLLESEKRIDQVRKTDLRVIVLGATGEPARGAKVRIEQTGSTFQLGFVLPESGLPEVDWGAPLWRCFNAVSLERMTGWTELEPQPGLGLDPERIERIERVLAEVKARNMYVRWGPLISADAGRVPHWAVGLTGEELSVAVLGYLRRVTQRFGGRVDQYDIYTQTLDHRFLEDGAGNALIRRLYESLPALSPGTAGCARFDDGLALGRVQMMQRRLTDSYEKLIPIGAVAIDTRFSGTLERRPVERTLKRIDSIRRPVVISSLTVGADSEITSTINMDLILRTLAERPNLTGIWFAGLTEDELIEPNAALIDSEGQLTPTGQLIDSLFFGLLRTDFDALTDELGNVRVRAFPGIYQITATLRDGTELSTEALLIKSQDPRVILLEPLKPSVTP